MAEETQVTTQQPAQAENKDAAKPAGAATTTPAEAKNTDQQQQTIGTPPQQQQPEHMIPKSRFDEVNDALRETKSRLAEIEKAQKAAEKEVRDKERKVAEEQGQFKPLYEKALSDLETIKVQLSEAQAMAESAKLDAVRMKVAAEVGLPPQMAVRLIGKDEEEIKADAEQVKALMPQPAIEVKTVPVTVTDGQTGTNGIAPIPTKTEREINEEAARLGVKPEYLKQHYEVTQHT